VNNGTTRRTNLTSNNVQQFTINVQHPIPRNDLFHYSPNQFQPICLLFNSRSMQQNKNEQRCLSKWNDYLWNYTQTVVPQTINQPTMSPKRTQTKIHLSTLHDEEEWMNENEAHERGQKWMNVSKWMKGRNVSSSVNECTHLSGLTMRQMCNVNGNCNR